MIHATIAPRTLSPNAVIVAPATSPMCCQSMFASSSRMICDQPAQHAAGIIEAAIMDRIARSFNITVVGIVALLSACAQTGPVAAAKSETASAQISLAGTYWYPVEIDGGAVTAIAGGRQPHLVLSTENSTVKGFAGCNVFSGKFTQSADDLRFGPLITTRMACQGTGNELEPRFLRAL